MTQDAATLNLFLAEEGFSRHNLDKNNSFYVTPLTLAIDSKRLNKFVDMLLASGANPVLPNARGYSPLQLAKKDPMLLAKIQTAVKTYTCNEIRAVEGYTFLHLGKAYKISRVIRGGASSIKSMEIIDLKEKKNYILKVKRNFSGLEVRNYISLDKYVDLFPIKRFMLNDLIFTDVYGLQQEIIPGVKLSLALKGQVDQTGKDLIISQALLALCRLHKRGFVHRDALPDNCHWDPFNKRAEFFDYDIMRNYYDLGSHNFSHAIFADFKRLLFGCKTRTNSQIKGLAHYTPNMRELIQQLPDKFLHPKYKLKILNELAHKSSNISAPKKLQVK